MNSELTKMILQLSGAGLLAIVILIVVFKFGYPALKVKKNGVRCVHLPEVRKALERNLLSSATVDRVELKVDDLQEDSTIQTTHLGIIRTQSEKQTQLLQELVNK